MRQLLQVFFQETMCRQYAHVLHLLEGNIKRKPFVYLSGEVGTGKTHLLQAICHAASEYKKTAFYLPLAATEYVSVDMLTGLENMDFVCLDDIDVVAGEKNWEDALLNLYNDLRVLGKHLIVSASLDVPILQVSSSDLRSRLSLAVAYQLKALDQEQKLSAMQMRAHVKGLDLTRAVGKFLLKRCSSDMQNLFTILEKLDEASLEKQRRITIPFAKQVLKV